MAKSKNKGIIGKIKNTVVGKEEAPEQKSSTEQAPEPSQAPEHFELPPLQNDASGQPSFSSLLARQREVRKVKALKLKAKADESAE